MWINREAKEKIVTLTKSRPVILLTGARQTGKSSLLQREFPEAKYITFDHLRQVEAAKESPQYFLRQFKNQVILDEIQYVPELFRELKIVVDEDRKNYGKWILTGSQQFDLMNEISESLAGRISIVHLETLSAQELRNKKIKKFENYLWKGGYPEIWSNNKIQHVDFFESYIKTYIERDLKTIIDVKNLNDFRRLIRVLATRTGQLINYKNLSNDVGVSDVTIKKWVHALQLSGLIYLLPPYYANIGKRLAKSPKIYFADIGFICYLLGIESLDDWYQHTHRGNLWENFVFMELIKTNNFTPGSDLFFYRDQNGVEIDFIIEKKGKLFFLEAKANERIDKGKLNFSKVIPLFEKNYKIKCVLALNILDKEILMQKDFSCFNPLHVNYKFI